jgi:hypothetical protein
MTEKTINELKAKTAPIFKKYGAIKVDLFGSRATGNANVNSDYDLLIEFLPESKVGLFKFQSLEEELTKKLEGKVDLTTPRSLNKYIKNNVSETVKTIYGK